MFVSNSYVESMKQFDAIKNGKPFIRKITEDAGVEFLSKSSQEATKMQTEEPITIQKMLELRAIAKAQRRKCL